MNARHGGRVAAMRCSVFFLCMFSFLLGAAVPRVAAVTYVYDVPYFERIDVRDVDAAEASSAQLSVSQEAFASPSGEARGASTTLSSPSVATEAGSTVRHYTTSEAAESIVKGGEIAPRSSDKIWVTLEHGWLG